MLSVYVRCDLYSTTSTYNLYDALFDVFLTPRCFHLQEIECSDRVSFAKTTSALQMQSNAVCNPGRFREHLSGEHLSYNAVGRTSVLTHTHASPARAFASIVLRAKAQSL